MQQTKDKIRIYALAKEWKVDSKVILDYCKELGFEAKNQLSSLEPEQVDALTARKSGGPKNSTATAVKPPTAQLPSNLNKPIRTLPTPAAPKAPPKPPVQEETPPVAEIAPAAEVPASPPSPIEAPIAAARTPEAVEIAPAIEAKPETINPIPAEIPTTKAAAIPSKLPTLGSKMLNLSNRTAASGGRAPVPTKPAPIAPSPTPSPSVKPAAPSPTPPTVQTPTSSAPVNQQVRPGPTAVPPGTPSKTALPSNLRTNPMRTIQGRAPTPPGAGTAAPRKPGEAPPKGGPPAATPPAGGDRRNDRRPDAKKPGSPGAAAAVNRKDEKKPTNATPVKFTPDQLKQMREGKTLLDIMRDQKAAQTAAAAALVRETPGAAPAEGEGEEGDDKKPGKVAGRNARHAERAKRAEKRKTVSEGSVIIKDGHAEVIEKEIHYKNRRSKQMMKKRQPGTVERKGKVPITLPISVRSLSEAVGMKVAQLLLKLKDLTNSLYTINAVVDVDISELIAGENGVELEIQKPKSAEDDLFESLKVEDHPEQLVPRAPVVTIMGHVDHGKTSLLDRIRTSKVVDTEAGGITQVIRAWRVDRDGKAITFLDTPGHEAFTKMRARGANVTDIAVIVVAADSGVKPQTEEAIAHAKAAGVSIVVAINKIDLPNADIKKTESQLYALELLPDTMGGDAQFVYTSAATGKGINELLDTLLLVAEVKELKANPNRPGLGTCLEAYMSADEGVLATLLVQQGTLRRGDVILCGSSYGRVRAMYNDLGQPIEEAGPSMPVRITGLDDVPNADDHFNVLESLADAREIAERRKEKASADAQNPSSKRSLDEISKANFKISEVKIILKAEARGSIEAIKKELEKLVHDEVRVRVLHAGIGAITESDVQLALASPDDSMVIGFNVVPDDAALRLAEERGIPLREYNIIYNLKDDIKAALEGKLKPREEVIHLGRAVVRETFRISRVGTIAGCYVTQGTIERSAKVRIIREGAVIYPPADKVASLESLKRFKDDVREVREGYDCGMKVLGYDDVKVGDVIEAYRIEQIQRTLVD